MTLKHSLPLLALSLTLTGCGVYKKYQRPTVDTSVYPPLLLPLADARPLDLSG